MVSFRICHGPSFLLHQPLAGRWTPSMRDVIFNPSASSSRLLALSRRQDTTPHHITHTHKHTPALRYLASTLLALEKLCRLFGWRLVCPSRFGSRAGSEVSRYARSHRTRACAVFIVRAGDRLLDMPPHTNHFPPARDQEASRRRCSPVATHTPSGCPLSSSRRSRRYNVRTASLLASKEHA